MSIDILNTEQQQFATDVLTTAIEGGINYWSTVLTISDRSPEPEQITAVVISEDEDRTQRTITSVALINTLASIEGFAEEIPQDIFDMLADAYADLDEGAGDIDAELADVLVQLTLFGEIIYG